MKWSIKYLFEPRSIAVIGASTKENSVGRAVFSNIILNGYKGVVYPVNPKAKSIMGVRCFQKVLDIPDEIDLAVIIVPAVHVPGVIDECGRKGTKTAIIISAGFKEIGKHGETLENQVKQKIDEYRISLIGPNCFGIINTTRHILLNATFGEVMPREGNIAFISQSGAVGVAALEYIKNKDIGLSKFVSIGNKCDISENEILKYLKDDEQTAVILLYLEDLANPGEFIKLAREVTIKKPILVIKSGRTIEGAKAAESHTGALAGRDEVYDTLFSQCGIIRTENLDDLFGFALAFSQQPLPKDNRIAILTNAGGFGIIATDSAIKNGLQMAQFEKNTIQKLSSFLPPASNLANPVDILGDADENRYQLALQALLEDQNVSGIIAIWVPRIGVKAEDVAKTIANTALQFSKPMFTCIMSLEPSRKIQENLREAKIPDFGFPEMASKALAVMSKYKNWVEHPEALVKGFMDVEREKVKAIIENAQREGRKFLPEPEAYQILSAYKFCLTDFILAKNLQETKDFAKKIGYPVVLKIVSPDILHKVDIGGVRVDIKNQQELEIAYNEIIGNVKRAGDFSIWGVLVQKMISGKEAIIGARRDEHFGLLLMFGLGGVYVELLQDVVFRIAPLRKGQAKEMIKQIKGYKIFEGARGQPPSDIDAIATHIERLSQLCMDFEQIKEVDINPLFVLQKGLGVIVADARILLK
jgi:acetyltransferase